MNVFQFTDYKQLLRQSIKDNSAKRGYKTLLAQAASCQKSFLSRVVSSHVQLTPEHALGIANFWKLNSLEREFFLALVDQARAGTRELRDLLRDKIKRLKTESENLTKRFLIPEESMETDAAAIYYSSWHYQAVFFLMSIPQFKTTKAIAERLEISESIVHETLATLARLKLVEQRGDSWAPLHDNLYVSRDSYLSKIYHAQWLHRSSVASFQSPEKNIQYTCLHTLSFDDFEVIRQMIFKLIDDTRKLVEPSPEEELICVNLNLFRV